MLDPLVGDPHQVNEVRQQDNEVRHHDNEVYHHDNEVHQHDNEVYHHDNEVHQQDNEEVHYHDDDEEVTITISAMVPITTRMSITITKFDTVTRQSELYDRISQSVTYGRTYPVTLRSGACSMTDQSGTLRVIPIPQGGT